MQGSNPITQRLDRLADKWMAFSRQPANRLFRWLVKSDESRMVQAFFEREASEEGICPDLFLRFRTAFEAPDDYAAILFREFGEQMETVREELKEENIPFEWQPPAEGPKASAVRLFLDTLQELAAHFSDLPPEGLVVAWLSPDPSGDAEAWSACVNSFLGEGVPDRVRLMVVDTESWPLFEEAAQLYPEAVATVRPELDMDVAVKQLAAAGNPGQPDSLFRRAYVDLTQAINAGNFRRVDEKAAIALQLARENNWPGMQYTVWMTHAMAYFNQRDYEEALNRYREAKKLAQNIAVEDEKVGGTLQVKAVFAEAAVYFALKDYESAAMHYESVVPLAEEIEDNFSAMEGLRMAALCHQMNKDKRRSWEFNKRALQLAHTLDESMQKNSTVPYVGSALLNLVHRYGGPEEEADIRRQMQSLVGPDWETRVAKKEKN